MADLTPEEMAARYQRIAETRARARAKRALKVTSVTVELSHYAVRVLDALAVHKGRGRGATLTSLLEQIGKERGIAKE